MIHRRQCLTMLAAMPLVTAASSLRAQAQPLIVYADGLMNGWWIGGWAKTVPQMPLGDQKPVQVTMEGWNVMTFQTSAPLDTTPFSTLTIVVHGGDTGKQEFKLSARLGEKLVSQEMTIRCNKGEWGRVDVPLKKMKIKGPIDTLYLQNQTADALAPFYVNYVLFQ